MTETVETVWELPRHMRAAVQGTFSLSQPAIDNTSPWTGERSPYGPFVQVWMAEIKPPAALSAGKAQEGQPSWRDWQGFITRLRGTTGKVRLVDYYRMRPVYDEKNAGAQLNWSVGSSWSDGSQWSTGALPPFGTLDEPAVSGQDSIVLRGLPANVEGVLNPGDLIELRPNGIPTPWGNLYEITAVSRTNAAGKCRVYFEGALHDDFAMGDMVVLREPTCVFRLADKDQGIVMRSLGNVGNLGFKLIEATRDV